MHKLMYWKNPGSKGTGSERDRLMARGDICKIETWELVSVFDRQSANQPWTVTDGADFDEPLQDETKALTDVQSEQIELLTARVDCLEGNVDTLQQAIEEKANALVEML